MPDPFDQLERLLDRNAQRVLRGRRPLDLERLFRRALKSRRRNEADWIFLLFQVLSLDSGGDSSTLRIAASRNGRIGSVSEGQSLISSSSSHVRKSLREIRRPDDSASTTYRPNQDSLNTPSSAALRSDAVCLDSSFSAFDFKSDMSAPLMTPANLSPTRNQ